MRSIRGDEKKAKFRRFSLDGIRAVFANGQKYTFGDGYSPKETEAMVKPLQDAIDREKAVVPKHLIYVDSDPRLKSTQNPRGLLVANFRDEPSGGFQGVDRALSSGQNPKTVGAANGLVPNYATFNASSNLRGAPTTVLGGVASTGLLLSASEIAKLNKLFETLKKVNSLTRLDKVGDQILAFADNLDAVSKKKVEGSLGRSFPKNVNRIKDDLIAKYPGETTAESALRKSLTNLSDNSLSGVSNLPVDNTFARSRAFAVATARKALDKPSKNIDSVIDLSRASTLDDEFKTSVKREIAEGKNLSEAMKFAAAEWKKNGGTVEGLNAAILKNVRSLDRYETNLRTNQETAKRSSVVALAQERVSQGAILKPGSTLFKALTGNAEAEARQEHLQRIGKSESDVLTPQEQKSQDKLVNARVKQVEKRLASPPNFEKLLEKLDTQTGFFGNFTTSANRIVKSDKLTKEEAQVIRNQAITRAEERRTKFANAGIALSILAPTVGGFIPEGEGGTDRGKRLGAISGGLQGIGTGAALGSFVGPAGAAIGAGLGGIIGGFSGFISKAEISFEELSRSIQKVTADNQKLINSTNEYIRQQGSLEEAIRSNSKPEIIERIIKNQRQALSTLPVDEQKRVLSAGFQFDKLSNVAGGIADEVLKQDKRSSAVSSIFSFVANPNAKNRKDAVENFGEVDIGNDQSILRRLARGQDKNQLKVRGKSSLEADIKTFLDSTNLDDTERKNALNKLRTLSKDNPEEFQEFFRALGKRLDDSKKLIPLFDAVSRAAIVNADISKKLSKGARDLESNVKLAEVFQSSVGRLQDNIFSTVDRLGGVSENTQLDKASSFRLSATERDVSAANDNALIKTRAEFTRALADDSGDVSKALTATSFEEFAEILSKKNNEKLEAKLVDVVDELRVVQQNGKLLVTEAKVANALQQLELKAVQQAKLLSNAGFNPTTVSQFERLGVTERLAREGSRGRAVAANQGLEQIKTLDSLGLVRTDETFKRERTLQLSSARETLSQLLGGRLNESVGTSNEDLKNAATKLKDNGNSPSDVDLAKRSLDTIKLLDFNVQKERDALARGENANITDLVKAGGLSADTASIVGPLVKISANSESSTLILEDIRVLMAQQVVNRESTDAQFDLIAANAQFDAKVPFNPTALKNGALFTPQSTREEVKTKLNDIITENNKLVKADLPSKHAADIKKIKDEIAKRGGGIVDSSGVVGSGVDGGVANKVKKESAEATKSVEVLGDTITNTSTAQQSFFAGMKERFAQTKKDLNDLSSIGYAIAENLEDSLGNAFGDFATGAKSGKEAFRDFAVSVLGDASRLFAKQAVSGLIQSFGIALTRANGGEIPAFARGGMVPAMLTGGEYFFSPQRARELGPVLSKINNGALPRYANGGEIRHSGLIRGGSGMYDDVHAKVATGGYVVKKSSVEKYGVDYLDALAHGRSKKRFWGGLLTGALVGGGVGYATGGKKGAITGAIVGGIGGGLYQNYAQTGNVFSSAKGAGFMQFSPNAAGAVGPYTATPAQYAAATSPSAAGGMDWSKILGQFGASAALGIGSALLQPKEDVGKIWSDSDISRNRGIMEREESDMINARSKPAMLELNPQGGYSLVGFGEPATRRWANGGDVNIERGHGADLAPLARYADGGTVQSPSEYGSSSSESSPDVNINITINNEGGVSSSKSGSDKNDNSSKFAETLGKEMESTALRVIQREKRQGGLLYNSN